jgi:signal transduction histidine kinase
VADARRDPSRHQAATARAEAKYARSLIGRRARRAYATREASEVPGQAAESNARRRSGDRRFAMRAIPLVVASIAAGALLALGAELHVSRRAERSSARMATEVVPAQLALNELGQAAAELALTAAIDQSARTPENRARVGAAQQRFEAALALVARYRASSPEFPRARYQLAEFATEALADASQPARAAMLPLDADEAFEVVREQSVAAATDGMRTFAGIAQESRNCLWFLVGIMSVVTFGCLVALGVAAGREKRAVESEACALERLHQRNADLDAFAGRVAHDLRNPLSPILVGVQSIERADVPPEVRKLALGVERSARRLLDMINVLLEFTRSGAPASDVECDVPAVIDEAVGFFRDRCRELECVLESSVESGLRARCEPAILSSVMQNLIDNALKYGLDGAAHRVVSVRARADGVGSAVIEVEDEGPGVRGEFAERVFEPRFQEHYGSSGLGLGLATVKRLVASRGGSVELERGGRGGALFRVRFTAPIAASASS